MKCSNLTLRYALVQAAFWMCGCVGFSFTTVYLKGLGYSNTEMGAVFAIGCLLSSALGVYLSTLIDKYKKITAEGTFIPVLAVETAAIFVLFLINRAGAVTTLIYILYLTVALSANSLFLKLYADAVHEGISIDYGIARAAGSAAFVVASMVLGFWVEASSVRAITLAGLIFCAAQAGAVSLFKRGVNIYLSDKRTKAPEAGEVNAINETMPSERQEDIRERSLSSFAASYPGYMLMLLGITLIFYSHNVVCNFMINITDNVGAGTGNMGVLTGFMASVELPVMIFYTKVFGRMDTRRLLIFSFVFYVLKSAAFAAAASFGALMAAALLQAPSYALYTAAIVPYVDENLPHEDSAKAQSLAFTMTNIGSMLAGSIGGLLYDRISVTPTLWVATAVCAAGGLIASAGLQSKKHRGDSK